MVAIERTLFLESLSSSHLHRPKRNSKENAAVTLAKKRDLAENSRAQKQPIYPFRVSKTILAQSAVAGHSGDWSRIGVISKESEALLEVAALVVIPLCIFLIFSLSKEEQA